LIQVSFSIDFSQLCLAHFLNESKPSQQFIAFVAIQI